MNTMTWVWESTENYAQGRLGCQVRSHCKRYGAGPDSRTQVKSAASLTWEELSMRMPVDSHGIALHLSATFLLPHTICDHNKQLSSNSMLKPLAGSWHLIVAENSLSFYQMTQHAHSPISKCHKWWQLAWNQHISFLKETPPSVPLALLLHNYT